MRIRTKYAPLSTHPHRCPDFDWRAIDDDTYEPGDVVGYGSTQIAAVADLLYQLDGIPFAPDELPAEERRGGSSLPPYRQDDLPRPFIRDPEEIE